MSRGDLHFKIKGTGALALILQFYSNDILRQPRLLWCMWAGLTHNNGSTMSRSVNAKDGPIRDFSTIIRRA